MIPHSTEVSKIQDLKFFSDECSDFLNHHTSDLARIVWNSRSLLKQNLCYLLCKSIERDGLFFSRAKINMFPLASDC